MRELDDWENYVKDKRLEPDYDANAGAYLVATLKVKCKEAYEYIMDEVEGSSLLRDICERIIDDDKDTVESNLKTLTATTLNSYIEYALDVINNLPIDDEQCDIEAFKRDRELRV